MKGLLHREARRWLALALERASSPPQARMDVLRMLSAVALWQERDYAQADLLAAEWLSIAERTGDETRVLRALNTMALTAQARRDFDEARTRFVSIKETAEKIGDRSTVAVATVNLSGVGLKSGEFQAGLDDATEAVGLFRELGDDGGVAVALGNCGWSALRLSDPVSAEGFFREGVVVAGRLGATGYIADHAPGLAAALVARHEYERAAELLGAAASLREELERGFDDEEHEQLHERVGRGCEGSARRRGLRRGLGTRRDDDAGGDRGVLRLVGAPCLDALFSGSAEATETTARAGWATAAASDRLERAEMERTGIEPVTSGLQSPR